MTDRLLAPKWANIVLAGSGIVVFLTLVLIVWGGPKILSDADEVNRGFDAAQCRTQFSSQITDARTRLDNARAALTVAQFEGQVYGLVEQDDAKLAASIARGRAASKEIDRYSAEASTANDDYQALLIAEVAEHDRFEKMCKAGPPR